jgi:hypothetical protein
MEENTPKEAPAEKPAPHDTVLVVQDIVHKSLLHVGPLTTAPKKENDLGKKHA